MQEVMDTVNPGFWEQWKATEKRIAGDDKHVKCDHCGCIVSVVGPTDDGKRAMCDDCETRLSSRDRVFVVQSNEWYNENSVTVEAIFSRVQFLLLRLRDRTLIALPTTQDATNYLNALIKATIATQAPITKTRMCKRLPQRCGSAFANLSGLVIPRNLETTVIKARRHHTVG
ncbi:MAG: hypothetical protein ACXVIL_09590 [Halobacteriota archaeon]